MLFGEAVGQTLAVLVNTTYKIGGYADLERAARNAPKTRQ